MDRKFRITSAQVEGEKYIINGCKDDLTYLLMQFKTDESRASVFLTFFLYPLSLLSEDLFDLPYWFGPHAAYTMSKYHMSLSAFGLAAELAGFVGVNAIRLETAIWIAAGLVRERVHRERLFQLMQLTQSHAEISNWELLSR